MSQLLRTAVCCVGLVCLSAIESSVAEEAEPAAKKGAATSTGEANPVREAIQKVLLSYTEAFNKGDAKTLSSLWTQKGLYVDEETGERTEGREALEADFATLFKENEKARLSGRVIAVRNVTPDVVSAEGTATVVFPDHEPNETTFSAVLVKQGDAWLLDSVHESSVPNPPTPADALKDLEWLVGRWVDESDDVRVDTTVRWTATKSFLLRSFVVQGVDGPESEGTQVIGWDARAKQIRAWTFNSDGSFGEGIWSKSGDDWLVKTTETTAEGAVASGTYVFSRVDDDTITVQIVGHEVDGEPRPSSEPVRVVRLKEQAARKQNDSKSGGAE